MGTDFKSKKIPVIDLGRSRLPKAPVRAPQNVVGMLIIDASGALVPPTLIDATSGDTITWLVLNDSPRKVHVKTKKFKKNAVEFSPILFKGDNVKVEPSQVGAINGLVTYLPALEQEDVKYTVEVRGLLNADYDPDLIIRRPPPV